MQAPIQFKRYFIADFRLAPNNEFDATRPYKFGDNDFSVETVTLVNKENKRDWQLVLKIRQQYSEGSNYPYTYTLEIAGFFEVHNDFPETDIQKLVTITGASMLFGAAREIVRSITSLGPFGQVLMPSIAFNIPENKPSEKTALHQKT